jgi:hypothetical protein
VYEVPLVGSPLLKTLSVLMASRDAQIQTSTIVCGWLGSKERMKSALIRYLSTSKSIRIKDNMQCIGETLCN